MMLKLSTSDIRLYGGKKAITYGNFFNSLSKKPKYIINAGMFDMTTGFTVCDTIVDGKLINGGNYTNKGFAFVESRLIPCTTEEAVKKGYEMFLGGSPSLIWDDEINIDSKGFTKWFVDTGMSYRIGIGIDKNGGIILSWTKTKMTVREFAKQMKAEGCVYAINLDGGGSTRIMEYDGNKLSAVNTPTENRAVSTWIAVYGDDKMKICIDAGHGQSDSGAVGVTGTKEKDVTLSVALKLGKLLSDNGVNVAYTRKDDKRLMDISGKDLEARTKFANDNKADYFISIHANSGISTAKGIEIYCYSNASSSVSMAKKIQASLIKATSANDRGVKYDSSLYVLKHTSMPAMLIECGFLSNAEEEANLKTDSYQCKLAQAIADAVLDHLGIKKQVLSQSAWDWAKENKLMDGTRPKDYLRREELATILKRYNELRR